MMETKNEEGVLKILKESGKDGSTITELTKLSDLSISTIRIALAKLEGLGKVQIRKAGMAKIYSIKKKVKK